MSRTPLPLAVDDITAFARSLRARLADSRTLPSHLEMLNCLARSAGYRNFQHFRAVAVPAPLPRGPVRSESVPVDVVRLKRLLRLYDAEGRLMRWPSKRGLQLTCLWTLWAALPARRTFDEPGVNQLLAAAHLFGDPVLLRRELCDLGLLWRTPDCRVYRRIERRPPPDALALIRQLRAVAN